MSNTCENISNIIPDDGERYRYFNQPLEQIPGFAGDKPQILAHAPNGGLRWFTVDQCTPVVTCLVFEDNDGEEQLKIERNNIVTIKDLGVSDPDENCPSITLETAPVVTCLSLDANELKIQRSNLLVIKNKGAIENDEECPAIPVTDCEAPA